MDTKTKTYFLRMHFESSMEIPLQVIEGRAIHPSVSKVSLLTIGSDDKGWRHNSAFDIEFVAPEDEQKRLDLAEEIAHTFLGLLGLMVTEGIALQQFEIFDEDNKVVGQTFGNVMISGRLVINPLPDNIVFNKNHSLALYWIGKGLESIRPDDQLSLLYAAVEALVPYESRKDEEKCKTCGRALATQPVKDFLVGSCSITQKDANQIAKARGDIVHGRKSAIQDYERFVKVASLLMDGIRSYFDSTFQIKCLVPDLNIAGKARFYMEIPNQESIKSYLKPGSVDRS